MEFSRVLFRSICLASFGFDVCVAAKEIATLQICGVVGIIGAPIPLRGTLRDRRRIGRTHARIPGITREKTRSDEHTSELQSLMRTSYAVFCLKNKHTTHRAAAR